MTVSSHTTVVEKVDASVRLPVLIFFGSAACWLVIGCFLIAVAGLKLIWPGFLDGAAFLTYGRIVPAAVNALVYGWASSAAIGIALWLLARLGHAPLTGAVLPIVAALLWQFGVFLGLCSIVGGYGRSIFLLEFPGFVSGILFVAYLLVAVWGILLFRSRTPGSVFVSSWYVVGALLWFPWLYFTGNALLIWCSIKGSAQAPIATWFSSGIISLWLAPVALAAAFYLIPQILGRRIVSYNLSLLGFWSFALFAAWTGTSQLIGGPVPAWIPSAGTVASILLFIPVLLVSINLLGTMRGSFGALNWSPSLLFTVAGAGAFLLAYVENAFLAIPKVSAVFNFTDVLIGQGALVLFGFVSMSFFGAIYFIVPRLLGREWQCDCLIRWHFWLFLVSVGVAFIALSFGGMVQGYALGDPGIRFEFSTHYAAPFRLVAFLCSLGLLAGSKCFAGLFLRTVIGVLEESKPSSQVVAV